MTEFFGNCPKKLLVLAFIFTICHWFYIIFYIYIYRFYIHHLSLVVTKDGKQWKFGHNHYFATFTKVGLFLACCFFSFFFSASTKAIKVHFVWFVPNRFPSYLFLQQSIHGVWKRIFCLSTTLVHFSCLQMPTNHICHFFST